MKKSELIVHIFVTSSRPSPDEPEEIQAIHRRIANRYQELKGTMNFLGAQIQAYVEWIDEVLEGK